MVLEKKNIHMDRVKCKAATQITLEDDIIVSDSKPDVDKLIFDKGSIKVDEVKATDDHVTVKGKLCFSVLYLGDDGERVVNELDGSIPFEEQIYMEGVQSGDNILLNKRLEDLSVGLINPRKLSIQSIIDLTAWVDELYDVEAGVEFPSSEPVECRKKIIELAEIAIQKKDIYRIKQEVEIPSNLPNIFNVLWQDVTIDDVEFKPLEDKLSIQDDLHVFVLYLGEGEDQPIRWYETTIPFSGNMDCYGSKEAMIADITYQIDHADIEVRADFDGEERVLCIDMLLDLNIKMYEECKVEILADMYGIQKEMNPVYEDGALKSLLIRNVGKTKIADRLKIKPTQPRVLQLCHNKAEIIIDDVEIVENGVEVSGEIVVKILYITSEDKAPFASLVGSIPFTYQLDAPNICEECQVRVRGHVEQINVTMIDSEEFDVKVVVCFNVIAFCNTDEKVVAGVEEKDFDTAKMSERPSIDRKSVVEGKSVGEGVMPGGVGVI